MMLMRKASLLIYFQASDQSVNEGKREHNHHRTDWTISQCAMERARYKEKEVSTDAHISSSHELQVPHAHI